MDYYDLFFRIFCGILFILLNTLYEIVRDRFIFQNIITQIKNLVFMNIYLNCSIHYNIFFNILYYIISWFVFITFKIRI